MEMELGLPTTVARRYKSPSQRARVLTETWALDNMYCPACPSDRLEKTAQNTEAVDFVCALQSPLPAMDGAVMAKGPVHIRANVPGASFRMGDKVKAVRATDETFDRRFMRRVGIVEHFEYSCGCGQTYPEDPMIGVVFRSGEVEEFWKEELKLLEKSGSGCATSPPWR